MYIRSGDRTGGFTLVELLVAAFLASMVLTLVVQILIPSLHASRRAVARMDLHQKALILNLNLEEDLKRATRSGVAFTVADGLLSVHRRDTRTATISWEKQLIVYQLEGDQLKRWEVPLAATPVRPVAATLPIPPDSRLRLSINDVRFFEVEKGQGPTVNVRILFENGDEKFPWTRTIFLPTSSH